MNRPAHPDTPLVPADGRIKVRVRGAVQGVGFRPFVWTLARDLNLSGWVLNDEDGVLLEVQGQDLGLFLKRLRADAPPLARIDDVDVDPVPSQTDGAAEVFEIRSSTDGGSARTRIIPDTAPCPDCLEDIFDPDNPRYGYAFTNCTHCGPRYTITRALPYDRAQTSMAAFAMCPSCQSEYDNPADRRFHAQPNACPECGPSLSMDPTEIIRRLRDGQILAIQGLGGFNLAVDARNETAVNRLRRRKGRDGKPFAVMVAGLASAHRMAQISEREAALLEQPTRPIVIAQAAPGAGLAADVSNGLPTVGIMLPNTPLHYLLFHAAAGEPSGTAWLREPQDLALVMTSANPSGEPLITDNLEAEERLSDIADAIVSHDRDILIRCDDSVVRVIEGRPAFLRRARGYTPEPIRLPRPGPSILAVGGHLKTTVCLTRGDEAFVSQHIGDLDDPETLRFFRETIDHLCGILDITPEVVACDLHPDFLSTRFAQETGLPLVRVQHHHAHIAAVAAEHHLEGPLLGLALDGFGLGADGKASWGGELLHVGGGSCQRLGGLVPLAQPGGDRAAREPWRMGAAALHALGRGEEISKHYADHPGADLLASMLTKNVNAPLTSSAGRLFDAACGALGILASARYEGEAPMMLEALASAPRALESGWRIRDNGDLDCLPLLDALFSMDAQEGANVFHGTLAEGLAAWIARAVDHASPGDKRVALSGGCFQNRVLTETLIVTLAQAGIRAYLPVQVPANDGGLSLGQAWVAAEQMITTETTTDQKTRGANGETAQTKREDGSCASHYQPKC